MLFVFFFLQVFLGWILKFAQTHSPGEGIKSFNAFSMCHSGVVRAGWAALGDSCPGAPEGTPQLHTETSHKPPFRRHHLPQPLSPVYEQPTRAPQPLRAGRGSAKVQPPQPPQPPPPLPGRAPPRPAQPGTAQHSPAQPGRAQRSAANESAAAAAPATANGRCGRERRRLAVLLVLLLLLVVVVVLLLLLGRLRRRVGGRGQRPRRALRGRRPFAVRPRGEPSEK